MTTLLLGGYQFQTLSQVNKSSTETTANQINRKLKNITLQWVDTASSHRTGCVSSNITQLPRVWILLFFSFFPSEYWAWTLLPGAIHTRLNSKPFKCQHGLVKILRDHQCTVDSDAPSTEWVKKWSWECHSWCSSPRVVPLPKTLACNYTELIRLLVRNDSEKSGGVEGEKRDWWIEFTFMASSLRCPQTKSIPATFGKDGSM